MRSGDTFFPQNEHHFALPHFDGRAQQKKGVAGFSISKVSAHTLPLLVMSRFPFSLGTSSTSITQMNVEIVHILMRNINTTLQKYQNDGIRKGRRGKQSRIVLDSTMKEDCSALVGHPRHTVMKNESMLTMHAPPSKRGTTYLLA